MQHLSNLKKETRYGLPAADQILFNRFYVLGYSYYFRQAKWALEIIDNSDIKVDRIDNFRSDYRVPERFRADKANYESTGMDRGHLVASANQHETQLRNSETFLLSNMAPQHPDFNRKIWKELEDAVRTLNADKKVLETYVISGPLFFFDTEVKMMESKKETGVTLPIPHAYFKSVLTELDSGAFKMWSFIMKNEESEGPIENYLVPTSKVEKISGLYIWETLVGTAMEREKDRVRKMWKY